MSFKRLIRFVAGDGQIYHGDAILPEGEIDVYKAKEATVIVGDVLGDYSLTNYTAKVKKLLSPLSPEQIPTLRCVGMNYKQHALELKLEIPKYPVLFYKPRTALVGPSDPIIVPACCQIPPAKIDYEVEMTIVIGKEGKDIPEDKAHEYILGYTIGNDVSQRTWQMDRGGTQFGVGKMFDTFAPLGPVIVSTSVIPDANNLNLGCKVNGITRQSSNTSDMIFSTSKIVSFMSSGVTLKPGDVIFTGTPEGVACGLDPPPYLVDGDVVEIEVENIGTLRNKIVFEKNPELIKLHS